MAPEDFNPFAGSRRPKPTPASSPGRDGRGLVGPREETFGLPAPSTDRRGDHQRRHRGRSTACGCGPEMSSRRAPRSVEYKERQGRLGLMLFTTSKRHLDQSTGRDGQDVPRHHPDPVLGAGARAMAARPGNAVTVGTSNSRRFVRTTGFHNWNRHRRRSTTSSCRSTWTMRRAGTPQGFPGALGMGNLMWSYLHNLVRDRTGDDGRRIRWRMGCSFRSPNLRGMTVEARACRSSTAVRDEDGETSRRPRSRRCRPRQPRDGCSSRRPRPSHSPERLRGGSGQDQDLALVLGLDEPAVKASSACVQRHPFGVTKGQRRRPSRAFPPARRRPGRRTRAAV